MEREANSVMGFHLSSLVTSHMPEGSLPGPVCLDGLAIQLVIPTAAEKLHKAKRAVWYQDGYIENSR